jgi:hypothetical protein
MMLFSEKCYEEKPEMNRFGMASVGLSWRFLFDLNDKIFKEEEEDQWILWGSKAPCEIRKGIHQGWEGLS